MLTLSLTPGIACRQVGHQFSLLRGSGCHRLTVPNSILNNLGNYEASLPEPPHQIQDVSDIAPVKNTAMYNCPASFIVGTDDFDQGAVEVTP